MSMLTLYDSATSSNALKIRFLLAELGLDYQRRDVPRPAPRPDWYRHLNPVERIPAIDDDGFVLTESNTILRYLARREQSDLYPATIRDQARVDEFIDRYTAYLRPALGRVEQPALGFVPGLGPGAGPADPARARQAAAEIQPQLELFEGLLDDTGYAVGRFSIADCAAAPVLWRTHRTGVDLTRHPRLAQWRDTILNRPAFAAAGPVA
jgi:glutathione S-transferase